MSYALIVVDVQNDFCPGGSLAVEGGDDVARKISHWIEGSDYDVVMATMDWHPSPGEVDSFQHFAEEPDFVTTWPVHCVQHTEGAALHPDLELPPETVIVRKGQSSAAYSGFEGCDESGASLNEILQERRVERLDIVGLATDHCVKATALDGVANGFDVRVLTALTAGVAEDTTTSAMAVMQGAGVVFA